MPSTSAVLWIVATPIGNLDDVSLRAREVLSGVGAVAAEDTRHSGRLLQHLGITQSLVSLHEYNERTRIDELLCRLSRGESIALISDAGTPLVSDPGFALVRAAAAAGIDVRAVPGPCAAVAALSVAGLPSDRFVFEGFLPARATARRSRLESLADETRTLILYESSHRIEAAVADMVHVLGADRTVALSRELTKRHEQTVRLPAGELLGWLREEPNRRRGEFVLTVAGAAKTGQTLDSVLLDTLLRELIAVTGTRQAAGIAARVTGVSRNDAYSRALALQ